MPKRLTFISSRTKVIQSMILLLSIMVLCNPVMAETTTNYGPISKQPTGQIRPGKFVWADLLTHDVAASAGFYSRVFGWDVKYSDDKTYAHASVDGEPVAAIAAYNEGDPADAEAIWLMSISVRDVAASAKAVKMAGGKILDGPQELPGRGQYVLVEDPRGALIMLLRASDGDPEDNADEMGDFLWTELWTDDTDASIRFYEQVIGYRTVAVKGTTGRTHQVMGRDQKPRASVIESPFDEVSPNWLPYVKVDDVDAVAMSVIKHGGKVLVPPERDDMNYHVAIVSDPTGGVFAIQEKEGQQ